MWRKRAGWLLPMLLVGCGIEPECVTPTGLIYVGDPVDNCEVFREVEYRLINALDGLGLGTAAEMGARVNGVTVRIHPDAHPQAGVWLSSQHGVWIAGYADCWAREIYVGKTDWPQSALAHELVHIIDGCAAGPGWDFHYGWEEKGYHAAIRTARDMAIHFESSSCGLEAEESSNQPETGNDG